jgi:Ca2+-binding EF-hand superfamily protein
LSFDEFLRVMLPVFNGKFHDEELWYVFKKFDLNNSNYITVNELKKILSNFGKNFTDSQISDLISSVDSDRDGKLNFTEFCRLMRST